MLKPPAVLKEIRDRQEQGVTFSVLIQAFKRVSPRDPYLVRRLRSILGSLERGGLIAWESSDGSRRSGRIFLTEKWDEVQGALGLSLTKLSALSDSNAVIAKPFFGLPPDSGEPHDVFVVMPFAEQLRPVFDDHIKSACARLSLRCTRADDLFSVRSVVADVWSGIFFARVVIADCTGRNPNVFYEMGLAHALGRPVVLLTQNAEDVPFDVRHVRFIAYSFTPHGMVEFDRVLTETLQTVLDPGFDNMPSSDDGEPTE